MSEFRWEKKPSSFQAKAAIDLAVIVGHPIGMCDEKYIVNEYLFWGPTPSNKWPTKNGVFFLPHGLSDRDLEQEYSFIFSSQTIYVYGNHIW